MRFNQVDTHGLTPVALGYLRFSIFCLGIHPRTHVRGLLPCLIKSPHLHPKTNMTLGKSGVTVQQTPYGHEFAPSKTTSSNNEIMDKADNQFLKTVFS
jgi:hypothetical protein